MGREDIEIVFFFPSEERSGRELNGKIIDNTPVLLIVEPVKLLNLSCRINGHSIYILFK